MSDCHFAVQLNHFIPGSLSYSLAVFLNRKLDLSLRKGARVLPRAGGRRPRRLPRRRRAAAQLGGARAPVSKTPSWPGSWASFRLLSLYAHRNAWASLHLLGRPNTQHLARSSVGVVGAGCGGSCGEARARSQLSRCTTAHPLCTGIAHVVGASASETTMRPDPRRGHDLVDRGDAALRGRRPLRRRRERVRAGQYPTVAPSERRAENE
jgi:hypothetical protein